MLNAFMFLLKDFHYFKKNKKFPKRLILFIVLIKNFPKEVFVIINFFYFKILFDKFFDIYCWKLLRHFLNNFLKFHKREILKIL